MSRWVGIVIACLSLVIVVGITSWANRELQAPGPLHPSHAQVRELAGAPGCARCHSDRTRPLAAACADCHAEVTAAIAAGTGLHGSLGARADHCGACHVEHGGAALPLVGPHAFAAAGVADAARYGHTHVAGYALDGAHARLACKRCHEHADDATLLPGTSRYLGLSQVCSECHRDPHAKGYGADCALCHGQQQRFELAAEFAHDARFPLRGGHADVACARCHAEGSLALATPSAGPRAVRACAECHTNPHADGSSVALRDAGDCARCHDVTRFAASRFDADAHRGVAFALEGAHRTAACSACHGGSGRAQRWSGAKAPRAQDCTACHASPHSPAFTAGTACATCHAFGDARFTRPDADLEPALHAASGFPLTAPHEGLACERCHDGLGGARPFAERFRGRAADDCARCHEDPHRGQLGARCVQCHQGVHFVPSTFGVAQHAHGAFPLTGAHQAIACARCHAGGKFVPTPTECASCHEDPHRGAFDGPDRPRTVGGATGCARCHTTTDFHATAWNRDEHARWTGFALRGAHATAECRACHGSPFARAPARCASCHDDVHAGQFAHGGRTDCARCHTESHAFTELVFDHARDTRFPLDATHRNLACSACHVRVTLPSGASVVRYRPLGTRCADCHGAPKAR